MDVGVADLTGSTTGAWCFGVTLFTGTCFWSVGLVFCFLLLGASFDANKFLVTESTSSSLARLAVVGVGLVLLELGVGLGAMLA